METQIAAAPASFAPDQTMHTLGRTFAASGASLATLNVTGVSLRLCEGAFSIGPQGDDIMASPDDVRKLASVLLGVAEVLDPPDSTQNTINRMFPTGASA